MSGNVADPSFQPMSITVNGRTWLSCDNSAIKAASRKVCSALFLP